MEDLLLHIFLLVLGVHGYSSSVVVKLLSHYNLNLLVGDESFHCYYAGSGCTPKPSESNGFLFCIGSDGTAVKSQLFMCIENPSLNKVYSRIFDGVNWTSWAALN